MSTLDECRRMLTHARHRNLFIGKCRRTSEYYITEFRPDKAFGDILVEDIRIQEVISHAQAERTQRE